MVHTTSAVAVAVLALGVATFAAPVEFTDDVMARDFDDFEVEARDFVEFDLDARDYDFELDAREEFDDFEARDYEVEDFEARDFEDFEERDWYDEEVLMEREDTPSATITQAPTATATSTPSKTTTVVTTATAACIKPTKNPLKKWFRKQIAKHELRKKLRKQKKEKKRKAAAAKKAKAAKSASGTATSTATATSTSATITASPIPSDAKVKDRKKVGKDGVTTIHRTITPKATPCPSTSKKSKRSYEVLDELD